MSRKIITCKKCGEKKPHNAFGLCANCYSRQNKKICKECGKLKVHYSKGLCQNCYNEQKPLIICKSCKKLKREACDELCSTCYKHKIGIRQPMHLNKECSSYLGVHVAEKLLSKIFKNVQQMPPNNKGFDFKCNKKMKIDVKSSVLIFNKICPNHKGQWNFNIKRNSIPDYFLCIAFDNRTSLTPLHLWLIPSKKVNHKINITISKSNIKKYSQYSQPIDKVIACCDTLKGK